MTSISLPVALGCFFITLNAVAAPLEDDSYPSRLIDINQAYESKSGLFLPLPRRHAFQTASVNFITGGRQLEFTTIEFEDLTIKQCSDAGYSLTACATGQFPEFYCPFNNAYFNRCCDNRYKYNRADCSYPNTISGDSCGGKYMCYCDRSLYPVTTCTSPQVPSSDSCIEEGKTYYSGCVCPSTYTQTCTEANQQGVGTGCTQNGVTKYTSCQCKAGYNQTCSALGPVTPTNYCLMNGIKYYNNCKTCENKCSLAACPVGATCTKEECSGKYCLLCANSCKLASCPTGIICNKEDCSNKYCAVGCATGYTYWCTPPITDCTTLGYTQTASQCNAYGYLTCPYNTAAVFCLKD